MGDPAVKEFWMRLVIAGVCLAGAGGIILLVSSMMGGC